MISGHGNSSAPILIVADCATDSDLKSGYAITGWTENKLKSYCAAHGIDFNNTWRTTLIKERGNLKKPKANIPLYTDEYKNILINEINEVRPNLMVPIGELSFQFLTGLTDIRKFRGSVLTSAQGIGIYRPLRVVPVLGTNPYTDEDPKMEFISRLDFGKVSNNYMLEGPIPEIGNCWVVRTPDEFRAFVQRHYNESKFLVFDIETYANIPTCISFCFDGNESVTVPLLDRDLSFESRSIMLYLMAKLLASDIPKVNQNIKFDWKKLKRLGIYVNNVIGDTMLAASVIYAEFPANLGFLTSIYTNMPYFKDEGKEFDPSKYNRDKLYLYCAKDSLATNQIYTQQQAELVETGTENVYKQLITILPIYREMEENGILVDDTERARLLCVYENLYQTYKYKLQHLVGRAVNPLSSKAMQNLVYDELKFKPIRGLKLTESGNYKADEESLELLMWMSECESPREGKQILQTILDCRKFHKVIEILTLDLRADNRFVYEINLGGAETGRSTSSASSDYYLYFDKGKVKVGNLGHSIQNVGKHGFEVDGKTYGKDIRSIFVPSPGYIFVENDLSQAEARVDAVLASDFDILKVFDSPTGIHRLTGSWVFDCKPEEIKKDILVDGKDRYHESKTIRHAGERNMREDRLMMMIHRMKIECALILKRFHDAQPNIRQVFHRDVEYAIKTTRMLVAPNGRRRQFFGRIDQHSINEGISLLPQAIVTDYLKAGIAKVMPMCRDFVRPLAEAHDGFLVEALIERGEEYGRLFKKTVEQQIDFSGCSLSRNFKLVIPCEIGIGKNWREIKEIK